MLFSLRSFPPVNSGGLIEAPQARRQPLRLQGAFPPVNSGGLIEAAIARITGIRASRRFPPVNSGGLIEAVHAGDMTAFAY